MPRCNAQERLFEAHTTTANTAPVTANMVAMKATIRDGEEVGGHSRASRTPPIQIAANVPMPTSAILPSRCQFTYLTSPVSDGRATER